MTHSPFSHNGHAIRAIRQAKGLTVTELSRRVGITPQSLSNIELEHRPGSAHTLNRIALHLGISLAAICRDKIATESAQVSDAAQV
ncbi:helix-turn-helix domain-containing protein [Nonomuraea helvata]|uniref:Helix-turn-helix domain-containing protein n=1 Tax=Nonomuraea helvata TaxID=37484 RepID=A0ABV5SJP5_9ACTN